MSTEKRRGPAAAAPKSQSPSTENTGTRLNVFLQERGIASRRKADELILEGRVKVDGKIVKTLGTRIPEDAQVFVDKTLVPSAPVKRAIYMFNKPVETLTSRSDPDGKPVIFELPALKALPANVQAVGRLDFLSEGLLLLTNDGDLSLALTHPRFSVEKTYAVLCSQELNAEDMDTLRKGVRLEDGMAKALAVRKGRKENLGTSHGSWVEIVVSEGRNRLIRRMLEAIGIRVVRLVRSAIGDLRLPESLKPGHVRPLTPAELSWLDSTLKDSKDAPRTRHKPELSEEEILARKIRRKQKLNREEYLMEKERSSAKSLRAERERRERLGLPPRSRPQEEGDPSTGYAPSRRSERSESPRPSTPPSRPSRPRSPMGPRPEANTSQPKREPPQKRNRFHKVD